MKIAKDYIQKEGTQDRLIMGDYSYGNPTLHGGRSKVIVGKFCSISDFATFDLGFQHNTDFLTTYPLNQKIHRLEDKKELDLHPFSNGDIIIHNDVWIADNAMIMSGVTIGSGAVVGYGAVVTKDVAPYTIVGGVPARIIRKRYTEPIVNALLKIAWWDWPEEKIIENAHLLMSDNIIDFIQKYN